MEECNLMDHSDHPENFESLKVFLTGIPSVDLVSKGQLLQALSSFLLSVATSLSASGVSEHCSALAFVGTNEVCFRQSEVLQLQDILFRELVSQTYFIFAAPGTRDKLNFLQADTSSPNSSSIWHLEVVAQTLRCCIRILPLLDHFDTGASLVAAVTLDHIMQQLCSPTKLSALLGISKLDEMNVKWSSLKANNVICCGLQKWGVEALYEQSSLYMEDVEGRNPAIDRCQSDVQYGDLLALQHRVYVVCSALEVYMDELLLRPHVSALFLNVQESIDWTLKRDCLPLYNRHTEASLEAAFVHVLLSFWSRSHALVPPVTHPLGEGNLLSCNLSLPAGMLLLDSSTMEVVPKAFLAHVAQLVARSFNEVVFLSPGTVGCDPKKDSFGMSDGVMNSPICNQEVFVNSDNMKNISRATVLTPAPTSGLEFEVLETAIQLYGKFSCASKLLRKDAYTISSDSGQSNLNHVTKFCFSKYWNLCEPKFQHEMATMLTEEDSKQSMTSPLQSLNSSILSALEVVGRCFNAETKIPFVSEPNDIDEASNLVSALLQLINLALRFILSEVFQLSSLVFPVRHKGLSNGQLENKTIYETLKHVCLIFNLWLPTNFTVCSKCGKCEHVSTHVPDFAEIGSYQGVPVNISMGHAIVFFENALQLEIQKGAPEMLLKEYFILIESLLELLVFSDVRTKSSELCTRSISEALQTGKNGRGSREGSLLEACREGCLSFNVNDTRGHQSDDTTTSMFLRATVLSLQDVINESCIQQTQALHEESILLMTKANVFLRAFSHTVIKNVEWKGARSVAAQEAVEKMVTGGNIDVANATAPQWQPRKKPNISTSVIMQKLLQKRKQSEQSRHLSNSRQDRDCFGEKTLNTGDKSLKKGGAGDQDSSSPVNPFLQARVGNSVKQNKDFDDLNDFIVCKKGRNYVKWCKSRHRNRQRSHNQQIWKRMEEKKELMHALDMCG